MFKFVLRRPDLKKTKTYNAMSVAGLVFGLLCMILCLSILPVPLFGGLALCFSILSRGDGHMNLLARLGIIFALIGIVVAYSLAVWIIMTSPGFLSSIFEYLYSWTDPANWLSNIRDYVTVYGMVSIITFLG